MQAVILGLLLSIISHQIASDDVIIPKNPSELWQAAFMARYIVHNTDWVSIATISTQESIKGFPYVSLKSFSDGTKDNSTGIPFLYMTDMDVSGKDVLSNNKVSIMGTLAETNYCKTEDLDPQDPRCAKVLMTGKLLKIPKTSVEYELGLKALFDKHPAMKDWPADHKFYVAKVDLQKIDVLDNFGGIKHVNITDYFSVNLSSIINYNDVIFNDVAVIVIDN